MGRAFIAMVVACVVAGGLTPSAAEEPPVWSNSLALGPTNATSLAARPGLLLAGGKVHETGAANPLPGPRISGLFRSTDMGSSWTLGQERIVKEDGELELVPITATPGLVGVPPSGPDAYAVFGTAVWRSEDDGATWSRVGDVPDGATAFEFLSDGKPLIGLGSGGLRVSADRSATWTVLGTGLPASRVNQILPFSATVILVATDSGLYRSGDAGSTFAQVTTGLAQPAVPAFGVAGEGSLGLYLSMQGAFGTGFYSSSDQGATWTPRAGPGAQGSFPAVSRGGLEFVVHTPVNVLYAATSAGLFRSGLQSAPTLLWERLDSEPGRRAVTALASADADPGPLRDHTVFAAVRRSSPAVVTRAGSRLAAPGWIDENDGGRVCGGIFPRKDGTVFAICGRHVLRSNDGGATWFPSGSGLPYAGPGLTDSYFGVGSSADGSLWLSGFHDGLYHSNAAVTSWSKVPFPGGSVGAVAGHPTNPSIVFASGLTTNGCCTTVLYRSTDGGLTWGRPIHETGTNIYTIEVNEANPQMVMVAAFTGGIRYSEDGGTTWATATGWIDAIYEARYSAASATRGYARGREGLFRTDDGGRTWEPLGELKVNGRSEILWELAPSPWDPDTLYVLAGNKVAVSRDAGVTFHWLSSGILAETCSRCSLIRALATDPLHEGRMYVLAGAFEDIDPYSMWPYRGVDPLA